MLHGSKSHKHARWPVVTTHFSPGETKILEEIDHLLDAQARLHKLFEELVSHSTQIATANSPRGRAGSVDIAAPGEAPLLVDGSDQPQGRHLLGRRQTGNSGCTSSDALSEEADMPLPIFHPFTSSCDRNDIEAALGADWPTNLAPQGLEKLNNNDHHSNVHLEAMVTTPSMLESAGIEEDRSQCSMWLMEWVVINPNSVWRIAFDIASVLVLAWDLTVIPYFFAWDVHPEGVVWVLTWFAVCFWTTDIILNCFTAMADEGKLVRDPVIIFQHYFRTWFVPDCAIVLLDWSTIIVLEILDSNSGATLKMLRIAKMGRLLRIVGMLRLLKVARVLDAFLNRSSFEAYRMSMKIIVVITAILWINHMLCCGWFIIGRLTYTDTDMHWTDAPSILNFMDQSRLYQYLGAFHWSLAQITLGATEVLATNSIEKIYSVLCMLFGLLFGSTLVSSLSATMVEFQMMRNGREQKMCALRQFLSDNRVDLNVAYLVQKQIRERLGPTDSLSEKDVPELELLSAHLSAELKTDIYKRDLVTHPLFHNWSGMDAKVFPHLCTELEFSFLRVEDHLFGPFPAEQQFYYLIKGSLKYTQTPHTTFGLSNPVTLLVHEETWIAEAAMWSYWHHVGTAEACKTCQLLTVPMAVLNAALNTRRIIRRVVEQYGAIFHQRLRNSRPPTHPFPTDLHVPLTCFADIVVSMDQECQIAIGTHAVKTLTRSAARGFYDILQRHKRLEAEVHKGLSTAIVDERGEVLRVVHVVAVRIENDEGCVLMQVATYNDVNGITAECCLPAVKRKPSEEASEAVERCLEEKLPALAGKVRFLSISNLTEHKESKEYAVRTNYLKTLFTGQAQYPEALKRCQWESAISSVLSKVSGGQTSDCREIFAMSSEKDGKIFFYSWFQADVTLNHMATAGMAGAADAGLQKQLAFLAISSDEIEEMQRKGCLSTTEEKECLSTGEEKKCLSTNGEMKRHSTTEEMESCKPGANGESSSSKAKLPGLPLEIDSGSRHQAPDWVVATTQGWTEEHL